MCKLQSKKFNFFILTSKLMYIYYCHFLIKLKHPKRYCRHVQALLKPSLTFSTPYQDSLEIYFYCIKYI